MTDPYVLGQLRSALDIPVPKVIGWSSDSKSKNRIGAPYILMERLRGRQLNEVWEGMSESQRYGLVQSLIGIERRLLSARLPAHGSIFYKEDCPTGWDITVPKATKGSKFVIGPTTEISFWEDQKADLKLDRGPCRCLLLLCLGSKG